MSNFRDKSDTGKDKGDPTLIVGQYTLGKIVGEGTFGKVRLGFHSLTGEKVAVKILEKSRFKEVADTKRVNREIKILKKTRHSNVIQLYEVVDSSTSIYLIMENAEGGEMFDFIVKSRKLAEPMACNFFHQILEGVDQLHKNDVTHRDLKPENLLLKMTPKGWLIKIVDFGLSNTHEGGKLLSTACGSPCYAAPEMIAGKKYFGPLVDIWSMGVTLFTLICGYLPFEDQNTSQLYKKILAGKYVAPKWLSVNAKDLIRKILEVDPKKRYTLQDIRHHVWYEQVSDNDIPKEEFLVSEDKDLEIQTIKTMKAAGLDTRDIMTEITTNAYNSLTASYYLIKQQIYNARLASLAARGESIENNNNTTTTNTTSDAKSNLTAGGSSSHNEENLKPSAIVASQSNSEKRNNTTTNGTSTTPMTSPTNANTATNATNGIPAITTTTTKPKAKVHNFSLMNQTQLDMAAVDDDDNDNKDDELVGTLQLSPRQYQLPNYHKLKHQASIKKGDRSRIQELQAMSNHETTHTTTNNNNNNNNNTVSDNTAELLSKTNVTGSPTLTPTPIQTTNIDHGISNHHNMNDSINKVTSPSHQQESIKVTSSSPTPLNVQMSPTSAPPSYQQQHQQQQVDNTTTLSTKVNVGNLTTDTSISNSNEMQGNTVGIAQTNSLEIMNNSMNNNTVIASTTPTMIVSTTITTTDEISAAVASAPSSSPNHRKKAPLINLTPTSTPRNTNMNNPKVNTMTAGNDTTMTDELHEKGDDKYMSSGESIGIPLLTEPVHVPYTPPPTSTKDTAQGIPVRGSDIIMSTPVKENKVSDINSSKDNGFRGAENTNTTTTNGSNKNGINHDNVANTHTSTPLPRILPKFMRANKKIQPVILPLNTTLKPLLATNTNNIATAAATTAESDNSLSITSSRLTTPRKPQQPVVQHVTKQPSFKQTHNSTTTNASTSSNNNNNNNNNNSQGHHGKVHGAAGMSSGVSGGGGVYSATSSSSSMDERNHNGSSISSSTGAQQGISPSTPINPSKVMTPRSQQGGTVSASTSSPRAPIMPSKPAQSTSTIMGGRKGKHIQQLNNTALPSSSSIDTTTTSTTTTTTPAKITSTMKSNSKHGSPDISQQFNGISI